MITSVGADENSLVMPDAWRRLVHPRRDRDGVPVVPALIEGAAERVRSLVDGVRDDIEHILALPGTAPDIADAARAHLRGESSALGAAAIAHLAFPLNGLTKRSEPRPDLLFADALVAGHGIAFAVRAFTEQAGIRMENPAFAGDYRLTTAVSRRAELRTLIVRHRIPDDRCDDWWLTPESGRSLRTRLAVAPDDVYEEAVELLAGARRHPLQELLTAYLAPTQDEWVEHLLAHRDRVKSESLHSWTAFCALGRPHQLAVLKLGLFTTCNREVIATLIEGVGPATVVPLLAGALGRRSADTTRMILDFLAGLPVDEAFEALLDRIGEPDTVPALVVAARRFPARAMRLLAAAAAPQAADLLSAHVRANPDIAEDVSRDLPDEQQAKIREILDANRRLPHAADLPPLLAEPPWTRPRKKAKPVVINGLTAPGSRAVSWGPGERDTWAARLPSHMRLWECDHDKVAEQFAAGNVSYAWEGKTFVLKGPDELVRPLLKSWEPHDPWDAHEWLGPLVARRGADAGEPALALARRRPSELGPYLLPLLTDEIALTMAEWLVRLKAGGRTARAWFRRHGAAAAPALIPDALGKPGPPRRAAEAALRLIADRHGPAPIIEAAGVHGEAAAAAIEALLAADPLDDLPKNIPDTGWAAPRMLPQILLRDRERALPDEAAGHVLTMLAMSRVGDEYAGVRVVRELCDPSSLAEFGWTLFRWWETCGAPSKENWALTQLALTGDDGTVRRLTPVIRAWPGDGGHAKAVLGLDVLAGIGTETALMHLHSISQRVKFKGLRTRAQEKIQELAAELGLSAERLADRLVPDFGLDASGTLTLDYGPRRFTIGFDELLRPTVADEDGAFRKSLPRPGATDDPELAPAAYKRFSALKKDARTVAADQIRRLEQAMVTRKTWPLNEFGDLLVRHPLLGHLVRRVIWLTELDGTTISFRVAEDGTFADADDDTVLLPETAEIRVAHPVDLDGELKKWTELFTDYEILQSFPQLARPVHRLTQDERAAGRLTRFEDEWVDVGGLLGLVRRGWERGAPMDAGIEQWISRQVAPDRHLVITLDPGIPVGDSHMLGGAQRLVDVRLAASPYSYRKGAPTSFRFGDLDPVTTSEVLTDLIGLTDDASRSE
ncbi:DUF4132 domain-containing protein [Spirillospora albida]|uniref:DUF4132 domain-containing protein n=1 Tax=Spirillospora albida TaxID=58123 RepID=UPI000561AB8C|nr:DUF4132 domain-containing protein [Spirillospora albida]